MPLPRIVATGIASCSGRQRRAVQGSAHDPLGSRRGQDHRAPRVTQRQSSAPGSGRPAPPAGGALVAPVAGSGRRARRRLGAVRVRPHAAAAVLDQVLVVEHTVRDPALELHEAEPAGAPRRAVRDDRGVHQHAKLREVLPQRLCGRRRTETADEDLVAVAVEVPPPVPVLPPPAPLLATGRPMSSWPGRKYTCGMFWNCCWFPIC